MGSHPTRSLTVDSRSPFTSYGSIGESSPDLNPFQSAEFGLDFDHARQEAHRVGILLGNGVTIAHFDDGWHLDHPYFGAYLEQERPIRHLGSSSMHGVRSGHGTSVLGLHIGGFSDVLDLSPLVPGVRIVLATASCPKQSTCSLRLAQAFCLSPAIGLPVHRIFPMNCVRELPNCSRKPSGSESSSCRPRATAAYVWTISSDATVQPYRDR